MILAEVVDKINGKVLCGHERLSENVEYAFSSDLMSDVLTVDKSNILLITGLTNLQAIRSAEMAEIHFIVFGRNKKVSQEMLNLAVMNNMVVMESELSVFKISGLLFEAGVKPVY